MLNGMLINEILFTEISFDEILLVGIYFSIEYRQWNVVKHNIIQWSISQRSTVILHNGICLYCMKRRHCPCHVNVLCEHVMWTCHVNVSCERAMWTCHVNVSCERVMTATCRSGRARFSRAKSALNDTYIINI